MSTTGLGLTVALLAALLAEGEPDGVRALLAQGRYQEAEDAARAAVAAHASSDTLEVLAQALVRNGRVAGGEAERVAREALAGQTANKGTALATLGAALLAQARPREAITVIDEAVELLRPHGRLAGPALAAQADARLETGDPRGSIEAADEGLALEADPASGDPALGARLLDTKTLALQHLGRWDEAAATSRASSHRLRERPAHPQGIVTELLAGDRGWRSGDMAEAGMRYQHAVDRAALALRAGHPLRTRAMGRLASWQADIGQLEKALPLHREALALARENLGPRHPRLADYLNDSANALVHAGDPAAAVKLFEEAVALLEALHGPDKPAVATPLFNLGWALAEQGDWPRAAECQKRALDLWRHAYGEKDARVLLAYRDWADTLAGAGRDAEAAVYYERVLTARLEAGEADHPATASTRGHLAAVQERLGQTREAARNAELAATGLARLAGWGDREYAEVQALRARLALRQGEGREVVLRLARDADDVMRRHVRKTVRFLGEGQAIDYVGQRFGGRDAVLAMLAERPADRDGAARAGLELVARSRSLVLDEMARRAARAHSRVDTQPTRMRSLASAQRLATLLYRGAGLQDAKGLALLQEAQVQADEADREDALAGALEPYRDDEARGDVVEALRGRLRADDALVSFCLYRSGTHAASAAYVAFVLRTSSVVPAAIPLGAAAEIDGLVRDWRETIEERVRRPGERRTRNRLAALGTQLGARLWAPLQGALDGARRVILVPDGSLHAVNFAALRDATGRYVIESEPTVHLVSSERDLLRPVGIAQPPRMLLVADPAFGDVRAVSAAEHRGAAPCAEPAALAFPALPASRQEADDLRRMWLARAGHEPDLLTGAAATESRLKEAAPGHTIVHVASHGFVLEDACLGDPDGASSRPRRHPPLLLAGIALAGANERSSRAAAEDDGILTAAEAAGLDLRDADWVVLSGCDTGRGAVAASEGVLGLQRALYVAGAHTVVMSLWPVDDEDARAYMAELYRLRLVEGLDTAESIRGAGLARLRQLRAEGADDDPSRWGAFLAVGDLGRP